MTRVWRLLRRVWLFGRAEEQRRWTFHDDTIGFQ